MLAATVSEEETPPETWPTEPIDLTGAAAQIDPAVIWARLEDWCTHRWSPRQVVYVAEGPGAWRPRLTPATLLSAEVWTSAGTWEAAELPVSPFGGVMLPTRQLFRLTCTVGVGNAPPPAVLEAFRRLAEYSAARSEHMAGATRVQILDVLEVERPANWLARAMHASGAADLLRSYRSLA
jgi:hypothetical protein